MKKWYILVGMIVWLGGCYFIGHCLQSNKMEQGVVNQIVVQEGIGLQFENSKRTEDNPWGYTAGTILLEDGSEAVLLNPNTALYIGNVRIKGNLIIDVELHPWVAEVSDGIGIDISLFSGEKEVYKKEYAIGKEDGWRRFEISFEEELNVDKVKISCNNGSNGDDSGDWAVIKIR